MENLKVTGDAPTPRFGHTITLVSKTKAVLFGGATGNTEKYSITGEAFLFDCTTRKWSKLQPSGSCPTQRAAHAATSVETNQLVIYGGAMGGGGLVPDDLYLLDLRAGEDNAQWIVVPVVGTTPGRRYGHSIVFSKPYLVVFGGNTGNESANDVWVLNVEKAPLFWTKLECEGESPPARVYHSAALCSTGSASGMMVVFGGRTTSQSAVNDSWGLRRHRNGSWDWVRAPYKQNSQPPVGRYQHSTLFLNSYMLVIGGRTNNVGENVPFEVYDCESSDWMRFTSIPRFRHSCWLVDNFLFVHGGFEQNSPNIPTDSVIRVDIDKYFQIQVSKKGPEPPMEPVDTSGYDIIPKQVARAPIKVSKNVRMSDRVVFAVMREMDDNRDEMIKSMPLNALPEADRKLAGGNYKEPGNKLTNQESVYAPFINALLKPSKQWNPVNEAKFSFKKDQIINLIQEATHLFANSPDIAPVIHLKIPVKIYGSIHGQFGDLMRLFDNWGAPVEFGDIEGFDYLFLGNYVDRGRFSLEVLCLLISLKLKYPEQFHLLRGSHEDIKINRNFGFGEECALRLGEDINEQGSVFQRFNKLFEYFPVAAIIQGRVLCLHSGIGTSLRSIEELDNTPKPIIISHDPIKREQQVILDVLWSDPVQEETNSELAQDNLAYGVKNAAKFTAERLREFLKENNLMMLIRSHECVANGFERIWNGTLSTVFSATDYCGKFGNAGGIIVVKKSFEITPKVMYPISASGSLGATFMEEEKSAETGSGLLKNVSGVKTMTYNGLGSMTYGNQNWIDNDKRPPTPPRMNSRPGSKKP